MTVLSGVVFPENGAAGKGTKRIPPDPERKNGRGNGAGIEK